jgi:hypothetical protein
MVPGVLFLPQKSMLTFLRLAFCGGFFAHQFSAFQEKILQNQSQHVITFSNRYTALAINDLQPC